MIRRAQEDQLSNRTEIQNSKFEGEETNNGTEIQNSTYNDVFNLNSIGPDLKTLGSDSDCPLSFPMVQQRLDEYNYKLQNQQNELLFIQKNIRQIKSLIGDLNGENDILKKIISEFDENYKIKNRLQSNLRSQEIKNYGQKAETAAVDFIQYETKMTEDVTNVTMCKDKIKSLKIMSNALRDQMSAAPALGADEVIDLLENDIGNLEKRNKKIRDKYSGLIHQYQDEIDQLRFQLEARPESYLTEFRNVPPVKKKVPKRKKSKKSHKK
ncbi:hypothetical protein M9Y10_041651 [Tritrichomonas musculus]|uniref:Uncharacterized protein n=1 Tax=Tritrichomonas musculus TaxID=1915356 RepID=A0ABR2K5Y8_9EUKA